MVQLEAVSPRPVGCYLREETVHTHRGTDGHVAWEFPLTPQAETHVDGPFCCTAGEN